MRAITDLSVDRTMGAESVRECWVDVCHENSSDVDGILLLVIEGSNGIKEGAVVDLCAEPDRNTFFLT
jgi:hypothetical protein